jgi:hypothetical protein
VESGTDTTPQRANTMPMRCAMYAIYKGGRLYMIESFFNVHNDDENLESKSKISNSRSLMYDGVIKFAKRKKYNPARALPKTTGPVLLSFGGSILNKYFIEIPSN